ncbi:hypothetical protein [Megalodesulfovibrio paquesii]
MSTHAAHVLGVAAVVLKQYGRLCLLTAALLATACAPSPPPPGVQPEAGPGWQHRAESLWRTFRARIAPAPGAQAPAFSATASLNYAGPKDKHRVVAKLWGNAELPIRLDLQAGVGAMVGHWREGPEGFLAFIPGNNPDAAAFHFRNTLDGMAAFGMALPLDLQDLARLLMGDWSALFPEQYDTVQPQGDPDKDDAPIRFACFTAKGPIALTLAADGAPVSMELPAGDGLGPWTLELQDLGAPGYPAFTPQRVRMTRPSNKETAILFLKELELRPEPWPPAALHLDIPPGVLIREQP